MDTGGGEGEEERKGIEEGKRKRWERGKRQKEEKEEIK